MRTPPHDLRLPGTARDAHVAAAEGMLRRLASAFPRAGLGVAGSVATGTHGPGSDVDLVVVDDSFRREMQFATRSEGIRTAILCLRPHFDAERERRWMLAETGDVPMIAMVRSAFVARDPAGVLGEMQRTVARLDHERRTRRDELMAERGERAAAAVRALQDGASDPQHGLDVFASVVDGWHLLHGLAIESRQASERMIDAIAERDASLATLLRATIPLAPGSGPLLLQAFDHVFGAAG